MSTPVSADSASLVSPSPSSRRRWLRIALWVVLCPVLVALIAAAAGLLWLRSAAKAALPQLDGDLHVAGLSAPVTVRRDAHGVPHIEAATQSDLFLAQGYVTAQDRLWQMDLYRRNASGELAEILGRSLVRHDIAQRVLQFRNTAQRIYNHLAPDERTRLDAYANGVNLYIQQHRDTLPPEFRLLHYRPRPWTGVDSLTIGMMMVQTLDSRWEMKLSRERIAARLHNARLEADLYPYGSWRDRPPTGEIVGLSQPHSTTPSSQGDDEDNDSTQTLLAPAEDLPSLRAALGRSACVDCQPGSNNWVIAGSRTASGKPLLANDMHLGLTVPNIWYIADLRAPGYHAAGVTLAGMPYVIEGHNDHVAWGYTALYADVQDLYVEKLDGKGNYLGLDARWHPLAVDHQVIHVRGGKDVAINVQFTAHGPLLNPIFQKETRAIALEWSLYDPQLTVLPVYAMNTAANWSEFSAALATWSWPTQNLVYADDQGHTAYHAIGRVPLRPGGLIDVPITDAAHEWRGYIPFDQMPGVFDPPSGFLATANSRVTTSKSPYELSHAWAEPYRAERIYKSLESRNGLTRADMLAMQTDIYSEVDQQMGHRFAYALEHAAGSDTRLRKAAELMRNWDGRLTTDSPAASLVVATRRELRPLILEPKLGPDANDYDWPESDFALEEIVMHNSPDWLPAGYKDWDALITEAVHRALMQGHAPPDVAHWTYGSWHVVDIEHPLSAFLPFLRGRAGTGPQPLSGDTLTVKQVGRAFGPSQRFTMDWSNPDASTQNIVLGESGNPLSPYFRDQWNDYYNGRTFSLPFSPAAVAAQTRHTLRLVP